MIPMGPTAPKCECSSPFYPAATSHALSHTRAILLRLRGFLCALEGRMLRCPSGVRMCTDARGPCSSGVTCGACPQVSVYACHEPWSAPGVPAHLPPRSWGCKAPSVRWCSVLPYPPERSSGQHPASKSCAFSAPDASTPWAQLRASHLLAWLAAKPAPSTDSTGVPAPFWGASDNGVGRQEGSGLQSWHYLALSMTELDTASCWASCFFIVWLDGGRGQLRPREGK